MWGSSNDPSTGPCAAFDDLNRINCDRPENTIRNGMRSLDAKYN